MIEGSVADHYLALPAEVLSTVMRAHQRYVPLYRKDADSIPWLWMRTRVCWRFLCIGNGLADATATVRRGNERVLKARLADAEFFVQADRAIPSIDRRDQLKRVTFAEGLGSLLDRVERLEWLTDVLAEQLECRRTPSPTPVVRPIFVSTIWSARWSVSSPSSRGDGRQIPPRRRGATGIALAVLEHYQPKGAGDALPSSVAGAVVALRNALSCS